jgi:hypothetical protein
MLEKARERVCLRAVRAEVAVADEECPVARLHASKLLRRQSLAVSTQEASARGVKGRREGCEAIMKDRCARL